MSQYSDSSTRKSISTNSESSKNKKVVLASDKKCENGHRKMKREAFVSPSDEEKHGDDANSQYRPERMKRHKQFSDTYHPVMERLKRENHLNPESIYLPYMKCARYFVMKSECEFDIYCSLKYSIWTSTGRGNKTVNDAFYQQARLREGPVYLFFSVSGSGHFYGMAQMMSPLDYNASMEVWSTSNRWKGQFKVRWLYVKDVPNHKLKHILLENNENKPVTYSRDAQEVFPDAAEKVIEVIHYFKHSTTIFDDFHFYEEKERKLRIEQSKKKEVHIQDPN